MYTFIHILLRRLPFPLNHLWGNQLKPTDEQATKPSRLQIAFKR